MKITISSNDLQEILKNKIESLNKRIKSLGEEANYLAERGVSHLAKEASEERKLCLQEVHELYVLRDYLPISDDLEIDHKELVKIVY